MSKDMVAIRYVGDITVTRTANYEATYYRNPKEDTAHALDHLFDQKKKAGHVKRVNPNTIYIKSSKGSETAATGTSKKAQKRARKRQKTADAKKAGK